MPPRIVHASDPDEFLATAGEYLGRREAEHNLLFGICSSLRAAPGPYGSEPPGFWSVLDASGEVRLAALHTPPYNVVLSMADDLAAVELLADRLRDRALRGVTAPKLEAATFAARWLEAAGRSGRVEFEERIFRTQRVIAPERPATGSWRRVEPRDREVVANWIVAFSDEATPGAPPVDDPLATADRWIADIGRIGYAWEDGDRVVSFVGAGGETPNGIRIGPVYTPPEARGRGYASSLTAAATQDQLDRGRRFVFLFTDLANPTSNHIYRSIGFEPVCDVDQWLFDATMRP